MGVPEQEGTFGPPRANRSHTHRRRRRRHLRASSSLRLGLDLGQALVLLRRLNHHLPLGRFASAALHGGGWEGVEVVQGGGGGRQEWGSQSFGSIWPFLPRAVGCG